MDENKYKMEPNNMLANFLINSAYTAANVTGSFIKLMAPGIAVSYVAGRVFSTDIATQKKIALGKEHETLVRKMIEANAFAKITKADIQKTKNEIKIIEDGEGGKIKKIFKCAIWLLSLGLLFRTNPKKQELQNHSNQLNTRYAQIEKNIAELGKDITTISEKDAKLAAEIGIQKLKQTLTVMVVMMFILPNANSIMGSVSTLFDFKSSPTGARINGTQAIPTRAWINGTQAIEVLRNNNTSELVTLANKITTACGTTQPYPCPLEIQLKDTSRFCREIHNFHPDLHRDFNKTSQWEDAYLILKNICSSSGIFFTT